MEGLLQCLRLVSQLGVGGYDDVADNVIQYLIQVVTLYAAQFSLADDFVGLAQLDAQFLAGIHSRIAKGVFLVVGLGDVW